MRHALIFEMGFFFCKKLVWGNCRKLGAKIELVTIGCLTFSKMQLYFLQRNAVQMEHAEGLG